MKLIILVASFMVMFGCNQKRNENICRKANIDSLVKKIEESGIINTLDGYNISPLVGRRNVKHIFYKNHAHGFVYLKGFLRDHPEMLQFVGKRSDKLYGYFPRKKVRSNKELKKAIHGDLARLFDLGLLGLRTFQEEGTIHFFTGFCDSTYSELTSHSSDFYDVAFDSSLVEVPYRYILVYAKSDSIFKPFFLQYKEKNGMRTLKPHWFYYRGQTNFSSLEEM